MLTSSFVIAARPCGRQQRRSLRVSAEGGQAVPAPEQPKSCASCGAPASAMKCDGTGRIGGGLHTVPGFSWWPIKAYRPCPALIESGRSYSKKGQDIDEVLFGSSGKK